MTPVIGEEPDQSNMEFGMTLLPTGTYYCSAVPSSSSLSKKLYGLLLITTG
mgnify:FL=1